LSMSSSPGDESNRNMQRSTVKFQKNTMKSSTAETQRKGNCVFRSASLCALCICYPEEFRKFGKILPVLCAPLRETRATWSLVAAPPRSVSAMKNLRPNFYLAPIPKIAAFCNQPGVAKRGGTG